MTYQCQACRRRDTRTTSNAYVGPLPSTFALVFICASATIILLPDSSWAQAPPAPADMSDDKLPINLKTKTLGGTQFWTDELIHFDWRIQRNVLTGHYRLLNESNVRQAYGTFEQCKKRFDVLRSEQFVPELSGRVVIALHGIARTRQSMLGVCGYLNDKGGYLSLNMGYASTRQPIDQHAAALAKVIDNLGKDVTEINFVTHSMGALVVRHYLNDKTDRKRGLTPDPRIRRIVMIGPPNNGTRFAAQVKDIPVFKWIWGSSGQQLGNWDELSKRLAIPQCQFGIIAGGVGKDGGRNPILEGDDDFVVSVDETRLAGAHDFIVLPFIHSLFHSPQIYSTALRFLQHGYFVSEEQRQPIR